MHKVSACLLGLSLLGASGAAAAQESSGYMKTFGSLSYQLTFDHVERQNEEGHGVQVSLGHFFTRNIALEFAADYSWFGADDDLPAGSPLRNRDGESFNVKLGGLYAFNRGGRFEPYVGIGGGLANNELDSPGEDNRRRGFGEVTLGAFVPLRQWWGLRGEAVYRYTDGVPINPIGQAESSLNEFLLRVGLLFPITRTVPVTAAPAPATVADSDGDGVPDNIDECPGTPAGVRVNARGCPLDSDADGVPDYLDECPGTAAGVQVDERGCPVTVAIDRKFEDVNFGFDKSNLTDFARSTLDKTAAEIRSLAEKDAGLQVTVEGHTDSVGPADYNQRLGERRARIVRDYLVSKGVEAERISTSSAGESRPIASNDTAKGRLLNRRAEIRAKGSR